MSRNGKRLGVQMQFNHQVECLDFALSDATTRCPDAAGFNALLTCFVRYFLLVALPWFGSGDSYASFLRSTATTPRGSSSTLSDAAMHLLVESSIEQDSEGAYDTDMMTVNLGREDDMRRQSQISRVSQNRERIGRSCRRCTWDRGPPLAEFAASGLLSSRLRLSCAVLFESSFALSVAAFSGSPVASQNPWVQKNSSSCAIQGTKQENK